MKFKNIFISFVIVIIAEFFSLCAATHSLEDLAKIGAIKITPLIGHTSGITSVAFSPDGKLAVSGSCEGKVCVWDVKNEKMIWKNVVNSPVHTVAFSPGGSSIAVGDSNGTYIFGAKTRIIKLDIDRESRTLAFYGKNCLVCGYDGCGLIFRELKDPLSSSQFAIHFWSNKPLGRRRYKEHAFCFRGMNAVCSIIYNNEYSIAIFCDDHGVFVYDFCKETCNQIFRGNETDKFLSVAYDSKSKMVAVGGGNHKITVCNLETNDYKIFSGHNGPISKVEFDGFGHVLAASQDKTISMWNVETGERLGLLNCNRVVTAMALHADKILVGFNDGSLMLLTNLFAKKQILELACAQHARLGAFSPARIITPNALAIICDYCEAAMLWDKVFGMR